MTASREWVLYMPTVTVDPVYAKAQDDPALPLSSSHVAQAPGPGIKIRGNTGKTKGRELVTSTLHYDIALVRSLHSTSHYTRHSTASAISIYSLDHLMQRPSTRLVICFLILLVCMPFISRPIINATRTASLNLRSRATATTTAAGFALFSSSSASKQNQNQNQQKMGVEKSESEWQAQLSPEQVSYSVFHPGDGKLIWA